MSGKAAVSDKDSSSRPIKIVARTIPGFDRADANRRFFGKLEYIGGLELSSSDPDFGGLSALQIEPDGAHFLALSDRACWLRGRIVYESGKPAAVVESQIAPVLGFDKKHEIRWDTEAIARDGTRIYVGVEGLDRILVYFYNGEAFPVLHDTIPFPPGLKEIPQNSGLEAITVIPKGRPEEGVLIVFSEKGLDKNDNLKSYIIEARGRKNFSVKRSDDYDISDALLLQRGRILLLERKFNILDGVSARLRKIAVDTIQPDALVDGPVVFEADMECEVDNMEAIGIHYSASGRTILTLLSDNNFSVLQRTLLLQFALQDEK